MQIVGFSMTLAMPNETTDPVITINEFLELEKCAIEKFPYKFEKCFYSQGSTFRL